jgi:hypothetical protein
VTVENGLGLIRSDAELVVVDAPVYQYAAYASSGGNKTIYDAERQAVYILSLANLTIERFTYDGVSDWTNDFVALPQLRDFTVSTDGKQIIAIADSAIYSINPIDLSQNRQITRNFGFSSYARRIEMANNGNALISTGVYGSGYSSLYFFNLLDDSLINRNSFYFATMGSAYDGSRVLIGSNGLSPAPSAYHYDSTSDSFQGQGVNLNLSDAVLSKTGTVAVLNRNRVYNADYELLGNLPNTTMAVALSPDGTTAYTFDSASTVRSFDLTGALEVGAIFPETGTGITVNEYVGNIIKMAVSPDGGTLFIGGNSSFIVFPL